MADLFFPVNGTARGTFFKTKMLRRNSQRETFVNENC